VTAPLFTIGHSNHAIEDFCALLERHAIALVADVRSTPYSRRNPHYNQSALEAALTARGIDYVFLGKELGARRNEPEAFDGDVASYERIAGLPAFREGVRMVREFTTARRTALLCAERDPLDCHRAILVARHLRGELHDGIGHILADGALESQEDLEQRLAALFHSDTGQRDLFSAPTAPDIDELYRRRGLAIAWRRNLAG
jgi:uncharacterized protein (DUF488 family)